MNDIELSLNIWRCPLCNSLSSISEWGHATLKRCSNRVARRQFKSLGLESNRKSGSKRWYVCPVCDKSTLGDKIKTGVSSI